jgi:hypothetical protein
MGYLNPPVAYAKAKLKNIDGTASAFIKLLIGDL